MAGIYIHIPFCGSRCKYCAFYSTLRFQDMGRYTDCVCRELEKRGSAIDGQPSFTVYLGGGTPSQLPLDFLARIMRQVHCVTGGNHTEVTCECNPDDMTPQLARGLLEMGFNRLSMGVQTFNDGILKAMGRRHDSATAIRAVETARSAGFENISIDLMYALPGQTLEMQEHDLETATSLGVEHISSYCLSYEPGTPLARLKDEGRIVPATDDMAALMYSAMCKHLGAHGYLHYEISNFGKPGYHSRHNSSYWDFTPYLGIGAAAHSFDGAQRLWNPASIDKYMTAVEQGVNILENETLSTADRINERVMLSLRTSRGLDVESFKTEFGNAALQRLLRDAKKPVQTGRLAVVGFHLLIPEQYWFVSDDIISSLFLD